MAEVVASGFGGDKNSPARESLERGKQRAYGRGTRIKRANTSVALFPRSTQTGRPQGRPLACTARRGPRIRGARFNRKGVEHG